MKKFLKIILWLFLLFIVVAGSIGLYAYWKKDEIRKLVVAYINQSLKAELRIGAAEVTFFEHFPEVSIRLKDIQLKDPIQLNKSLFAANSLDLTFNFWDIYHQQYHIHHIVLHDAQALLFKDAAGRLNYDIVKTTGDTSSLFVSLDRVEFINAHVQYESIPDKVFMDYEIPQLRFSGNFSDALFALDTKGKIVWKALRVQEKAWVSNRSIELNTQLEISRLVERYRVIKGDFSIDELPCTLTGELNHQNIQVKCITPDIELAKLFALFPDYFPEPMKSFKTNGHLTCTTSIHGNIRHPECSIQFEIQNGSLEGLHQVKLHAIHLSGQFEYGGSADKTALHIPEFSAQLDGGGYVSAVAHIPQWSAHQIQLQANLKTGLHELISIYPIQQIQEAEGNLQTELRVQGDWTQTQEWIKNPNTHFMLDLNAPKLITANLKQALTQVVCKAELQQGSVTFDACSFKSGNSDISIQGVWDDLPSFFDADKPSLKARLQIRSTQFNPLDFAVLPSKDTMQASKPWLLSIRGDAQLKALQYDVFLANDVRMQFEMQQNNLIVSALQAKVMDGNISINGECIRSLSGNLFVRADATLDKLNIQKLFEQTHDFGQTELTSKNISGMVSGPITFSGVWDANGKCNTKKIKAVADIRIQNGQLVNYKTLESLSRFVKLEDLKNIRFADLSNRIEILDETIIIPQMEIKNSALDLVIQGEHNFDNYIDYALKLKLNDLLRKKWKSVPREDYGEETDNGKGMNVYLHMKGPVGNVAISYDRSSVKQSIQQATKKEISNLKEIIRNEFSGDKKQKDVPKEKNNDDDKLEFENE